MGEFFFILAKDHQPSLGYRDNGKEFRLHSTYDPGQEAENLVKGRAEEVRAAKRVLVYGLGLGYHLQALDKYKSSGTEIFVLEMNPAVLELAQKVFSFVDFEQKGYKFIISDHLQEVSMILLQILESFDPATDMLFIHQPSLRTIPESCTPIRHLLEEWEVKRDTYKRNQMIMDQNFHANLTYLNEYHFAESFQNKFSNCPIIIVSAGPSLNKNKHLLSKAKDKALIIAVGSVLKPLLAAGVTPEMIVLTDPQIEVYRQMEGLEIKIPLFFFPTIQPQIVREYLGPKVMLLQKGVTLCENLATDLGVHLVETGGSVATTALELAIYFGGNPLIFLGQDLAYSGGKIHTEGTVHNSWTPDLNIRWVKGVIEEKVPTSKNLSIYRRWIENKIISTPDRRYINATEGGAHIEGTEILTFEQVLQLLTREFPFKKIIHESLSKNGG